MTAPRPTTRVVVLVFSVLAALFGIGTVGQPAPHAGAAPGDAPVTGTLFVDFDRDGRLDAGEGVADTDAAFPPNGITVTAIDARGATATGTVTPGSPPTFSIDVTGLVGSTFRVEFALDGADLTAGWRSTVHGPDSASSVQTAGAGADIGFGVIPPSECPVSGTGADANANDVDGKLWTTCFVNGDRSDGSGPQDVLLGLNYDRSGGVEHIADKSQLGSIWGVGYDEWNSVVFTSAYLKRHSELGPDGLDGLYWFTYPSETPFSVSLGSLGGPSYGSVGARDADTAGVADPSVDAATFPLVAKTGIGDIDVTPDGRTLLVTNIEAKALMAYDISAADTGTITYAGSYAITDGDVSCPDDSGSASASDWFPFAVAPVDSGLAYVGVSCTGQTSGDTDDLQAVVVEVALTPTGANGTAVPTSASAAHRVDLDYLRGCPDDGVCPPPPDSGFQPWTDTWTWSWTSGGSGNIVIHPQAVLSDINVEPDGSLTLTMFDRTGDQVGDLNYDTAGTLPNFQARTGGETLKVCNTSGDPGAPTFVTEGGAGCVTTNFVDTTSGDANDPDFHGGPGGLVEWYGAEDFAGFHAETTVGGAWDHPNGTLVTGLMDPLNFISGGLGWWDTSTGADQGRLELYVGQRGLGLLGKSNGIGDVEGCFIPIEIGDYVWLDHDRDGIQDPGEVALVGVTVSLYDATNTTLIASTTTDAAGVYTFGTGDGVDANTSYVIRVDASTNVTALPGGYTNADLAETVADANANGDDVRDSDLSSGTIAVTTGDPGDNDHTFDAGFVLPYDLALAKTLDTASPASRTATFDITITNQGATVETIEVTDYIDATWETFDVAQNPPGTTGTIDIDGDATPDAGTELSYSWSAGAVVSLDGTLPPGESVTVPVTLTWIPGVAPGSVLENWAEISNFDNDDDPGNGDAGSGAIADDDSEPDAIQGDDNQPTGPGEPTDDEVDEDARNDGGDEDDHDVAGVTVTVVPIYSLGNQVWFDADNDGMIDGDEDPIADVAVELYDASDLGGSPLDTTVTDADGLYLFDELDAGDYVVVIPSEMWADDAPLAGTLSSDPTEADPDTDVDADDNGFPTGSDGVRSGTVTLGDGEPTAEDPDNDPVTPDTDENLTVDFGFWTPDFDLALRKQLDDGTNSAEVAIGDTVTFVITVFNQGDVSATDIEVVDYLPAGLSLADDDWTVEGDVATISVPGTLAPGESASVEITVEVVSADGLVNTAEIADATPVDPDGDPLVMPDGRLVPDVDSTPDREDGEDPLDDEIDQDARAGGGDEDDHDVAELTIVAPGAAEEGGALPRSGSESGVLARMATIGMLLGACLVTMGWGLGGRMTERAALRAPRRARP